jgi:histidine ammonia-lyase
MAAHGARRLRRMTANLAQILGVEAICAAQGITFRAPLATSPPLQRVMEAIRAEIAPLAGDRYLAPDLAAAARLVTSGRLVAAAGGVS